MKIRFLILFLYLCSSLLAGAAYRGDLNKDGKVDLLDLKILVKLPEDERGDLRYDLNVSGKVDDADIDYLANLILTEKLEEDKGINVGIGGWEENGEDFGGSVSSKRKLSSGKSHISFELREPLYDFERNLPYVEIGVSDSLSDGIYLANIESAWNNIPFLQDYFVIDSVDEEKGAKALGTPMELNRDGTLILRFIVSLVGELKGDDDTAWFGRLYFENSDESDYLKFAQCQAVSNQIEGLIEIPYHETDYINWWFFPVEEIVFWEDTINEVNPGDSFHQSPEIIPSNANNHNLFWYSSDENIATVTQEGEVTVHDYGQCSIHARATDGSGVEGSYFIDNRPSSLSEITENDKKFQYYLYDISGGIIGEVNNELEGLAPGVYIVRNLFTGQIKKQVKH